jgi:hypothetical protein
MYRILHNKKRLLEISIEGHLTEVELENIISDLKSAKQEHGQVNLLLDFTTMTGYDKVFFDKTDGIESLENSINRVVAVSGGVTALPFLEYIKNASRKYRKFNEKDIDKARNWVLGK